MTTTESELGCCLGSDRPEQVVLLAQHRQIRQTIRAVRDRDREMGQHDTRIMGVPGDPALTHRHRQRVGQTGPISHLSQQTGPGVRHQIFAVNSHQRTTDTSITMHLQGEPFPWSDISLQRDISFQVRRAFPRTRDHPKHHPRE